MKNRQSSIYQIIQNESIVYVNDLAKRFNVTKKTIRIDLQNLEDAGLIDRNYGGATLAIQKSSIFPGPSYNAGFIKQKYEIAKKSLEFIKPNQIIILDDGTTNQTIARLLPDIPLTIITNDLIVAYELRKKMNINTYIVGGTVFRTGSSFHTILSSDKSKDYLRQLDIDLCFIGTNSINNKNGFMVFNDFVCHSKRFYISIAKKSIVVADARKFDKSSFYKFADFKEISTVITDSSFNPYNVKSYAKNGLQIIIADKEEGDINGNIL